MGLITIHGPRGIIALPSLPLGVPYPFNKHGAPLAAYGHPDHPPCPPLILPEDHLFLLLGGTPLDEARVDDLLTHVNTRGWGWF